MCATVQDIHHRNWQLFCIESHQGIQTMAKSKDSAAARATAMDTPRIAFAPRLDLLSVPSIATLSYRLPLVRSHHNR